MKSVSPPPEPICRRVLVVEDDTSAADLLIDGLTAEGFEVSACSTAEQALQRLDTEDLGVVLTDLNLGQMTGVELCERIVSARSDVPVIVMTAFGSMETAVAALRAGAYDFVTKPFDLEAVAMGLARALDHYALRQEVRRLRSAASGARGFGGLSGSSAAMANVFELLTQIAASDSTVLILGESGTGKEVVAKALHTHSQRSAGPFVAVDCAAMPEALLESQLFGHVRGAFTDARQDRKGLLFAADGGTLFLDEIGEMPLGLQPKLLRALQERRVRPVGHTAEVPFNARIITATNRDLERAIEERRFREDLYYRLNVISVTLPPLRARGGDALLLAQEFIDKFAGMSGKSLKGLSAAAAERLLCYPFPGNVRELSNCVERAVALCQGDEIRLEDLPERIRQHESRHVLVGSNDPTDLVPLEEVERRYILEVLAAVGGNKSQAAKVLGVGRKTLYRRLEAWGVDTSD